MKILLALTLATLAASITLRAQSATSPAFNSLIMLSTVKVFGPSAATAGKTDYTGTGFLVGRPDENDPKGGAQVLVTAAHIVDGIAGDDYSVVVRRSRPDGTYERITVSGKLRERGKALYVKHPAADVAAIYSQLPQVGVVASMTMLADDAMIEKYEITTGDDVLAAGYPLGAEGPDGFPILRAGEISSYPLAPMKSIKQLLINYNVWPGNSGGPVFMYQRARWLASTKNFWSVNVILGLVSQQKFATQDGTRLEVAVVVPAPFIRETVAMLPAPVY